MKYKEKKISRLRTGRNQEWFQRFYDGNYIGSDFGLANDVSGDLSDNWSVDTPFVRTVSIQI